MINRTVKGIEYLDGGLTLFEPNTSFYNGDVTRFHGLLINCCEDFKGFFNHKMWSPRVESIVQNTPFVDTVENAIAIKFYDSAKVAARYYALDLVERYRIFKSKDLIDNDLLLAEMAVDFDKDLVDNIKRYLFELVSKNVPINTYDDIITIATTSEFRGIASNLYAMFSNVYTDSDNNLSIFEINEYTKINKLKLKYLVQSIVFYINKEIVNGITLCTAQGILTDFLYNSSTVEEMDIKCVLDNLDLKEVFMYIKMYDCDLDLALTALSSNNKEVCRYLRFYRMYVYKCIIELSTSEIDINNKTIMDIESYL